jgi:hypothetical protein
MSQFLFQLKYAIPSNIYQQVVDNQMFISREVFRGALKWQFHGYLKITEFTFYTGDAPQNSPVKSGGPY